MPTGFPKRGFTRLSWGSCIFLVTGTFQTIHVVVLANMKVTLVLHCCCISFEQNILANSGFCFALNYVRTPKAEALRRWRPPFWGLCRYGLPGASCSLYVRSTQICMCFKMIFQPRSLSEYAARQNHQSCPSNVSSIIPHSVRISPFYGSLRLLVPNSRVLTKLFQFLSTWRNNFRKNWSKKNVITGRGTRVKYGRHHKCCCTGTFFC